MRTDPIFFAGPKVGQHARGGDNSLFIAPLDNFSQSMGVEYLSHNYRARSRCVCAKTDRDLLVDII